MILGLFVEYIRVVDIDVDTPDLVNGLSQRYK